MRVSEGGREKGRELEKGPWERKKVSWMEWGKRSEQSTWGIWWKAGDQKEGTGETGEHKDEKEHENTMIKTIALYLTEKNQ